MTENLQRNSRTNLDPSDWPSCKAQGHKMLDDIFEYIENIRQRPVWQPIPDGTRDHMPIEVERQIVHWMRQLFKFPDTSTGLFVTGSSMANLLAVLIARTD